MLQLTIAFKKGIIIICPSIVGRTIFNKKTQHFLTSQVVLYPTEKSIFLY